MTALRDPSPPAPTPPIGLRTALVHDWFQGFHGAERVVETMRAGLFPIENPPEIFTFHAARELLPPPLAASIVQQSRLASLPGVRQRGHRPGRWRYLLPYMQSYFRRIDLSNFELVIASSHACAINVRPPRGTPFVCYCHTPMRYAWLPSVDQRAARGAAGFAVRAFRRRLRRNDAAAAARPDVIVANSAAVRDRIRRFYAREAVIVHPPVDVDRFRPDAEKEEGLFLWVHRLVAYKRPELVVEAFRGLPFRLIMVGIGPLEGGLRARLPPNVELRGWLPRLELEELYQRCSGFLHVAEEDFGITLVEALAAGAPVIALGRGGALDIVRDGIDGVLVERPEIGDVQAAIRRVAAIRWDAGELAQRASEFSRPRFLERFGAVVSEAVSTYRAS